MKHEHSCKILYGCCLFLQENRLKKAKDNIKQSQNRQNTSSTGPRRKVDSVSRVYPGSEFVIANTSAKLKKLNPNEIDFSQGFGQKVVSRRCSVFNFCQLARLWHPLITFANSLDPDQARQNVGPDLDLNCLTH